MKLYEIAKAAKGEVLCGQDIEITQFSNDTRTIEPGALYVPIIGEVFDGHTFIKQAFEKGAVASLTSRREIVEGGAMIYVEDTIKALQDIAKYCRKKSGAAVIGVTGSVGKTSTKDMIASVVNAKYKTLKTIGNYNNHIGLPLTILRHTDEKAMVLEMGMDHLREIAVLTDIAKPNIGVITNVGTAHIGYLGSRENILKAKLEITEGLDENGVLIINNDNDMLHHFYETVNDTPYQIKTFGLYSDCDVKATNVELKENGSSFDYAGVHFEVPVPGEHFVLNALSAIAVGECLNIDLALVKEAISNFTLTKNRMDMLELKDNVLVIDGTYNASLDSMKSSLAVLGRYERRKIAILADILELGEYSSELHIKTGEAVDENKIDVLICVGEESKKIIEGAKNTKDKHWFKTNEEVFDYLKSILKENDVVLFKGSNGMHLKEIIEKLKEENHE